MKYGFVKVAAVTPEVKVADVDFNVESIMAEIDKCAAKHVKVMVFPELCITGATCRDLFLQKALISSALEGLKKIKWHSKDVDALIVVGLPLKKEGKLYDVAAVVNRGDILGFVPKTVLSNHGEFNDSRWFASGEEIMGYVSFDGDEVAIGTNLLFNTETVEDLVVACEIGNEPALAETPSVAHVQAGATLILNPQATAEIVGRTEFRRNTVASLSGRLACGYVSAGAGFGESTTDYVYGGQRLIGECGDILAESELYGYGALVSDIDVERIAAERIRSSVFDAFEDDDYLRLPFYIKSEDTLLDRFYSKTPFIPCPTCVRGDRMKEIFDIQCMGLRKRCLSAGAKKLLIGISGGLDSTLAFLVAIHTADLLGLSREDVIAVTMPCFGTSERTHDNAIKLCESLGATFKEVNIKDSVLSHFKDIDQPFEKHDAAFENAQARERTQVLMDMANQCSGLVVGTGDLSELALGWATYNGDHMSMYCVNGDITKTTVRAIVKWYAEMCDSENLAAVLQDIIDTPVSPELLPPSEGEISQKTEELLGPYELHDFFLYYTVRFGFTPAKIKYLARVAFKEEYDEALIEKCLGTFLKRFRTQQFKRSCLPDGPAVGTVGLSPRGGFMMPSDAGDWTK
jgi:NAD+ synthase (glutamine-hydrolysing)